MWTLKPATWICRTPAVGVSFCKKSVSFICRGRIQKCPNDSEDFFFLFRMLVDRLSTPELERWAVTSWAIWNARNKFYFERVQSHPKSILDGAIGFLQEYQKLVEAQRKYWLSPCACYWAIGVSFLISLVLQRVAGFMLVSPGFVLRVFTSCIFWFPIYNFYLLPQKKKKKKPCGCFPCYIT